MWVCGNGSDLRATKLDNREHREELLPRPLRRLCTFLGVLSSENGELARGGSPEEETTRDQPYYYYYTDRERAHETNESSRPSLVSIVIIFDYVNNRFLRRRCSSSRAANRSSTSLLDRVRRSRCKQLLLLLSPLGLVHTVLGTRSFSGWSLTGDSHRRSARFLLKNTGPPGGRERRERDENKFSLHEDVDLSKSEPGPASRTNLIYTNRSFDMLIVSRLATT